MTAKHDLHELIDRLSEEKAARLLTLLSDPVELSLLTAPLDDEPTTPEEDAGAAEAHEEYLRGEGRSLADVRADWHRRHG